jgi:hypothetical protein
MLIEKVMLDYLNNNGIETYAERPAKPPEEYVIIQKTGSRETDLVVTSTIAFQSYAKTLADAMILNERVKALLNRADTITCVSAASLNSDYNFTSSGAKQYRYQAVYEIVHKE